MKLLILIDDDVDGAMTVLQELITSIRAIRSRMNIAPSKNVDLKIKCSKDQSDLISQNKKLIHPSVGLLQGLNIWGKTREFT